jgi:hypothetical protein
MLYGYLSALHMTGQHAPENRHAPDIHAAEA